MLWGASDISWTMLNISERMLYYTYSYSKTVFLRRSTLLRYIRAMLLMLSKDIVTKISARRWRVVGLESAIAGQIRHIWTRVSQNLGLKSGQEMAGASRVLTGHAPSVTVGLVRRAPTILHIINVSIMAWNPTQSIT